VTINKIISFGMYLIYLILACFIVLYGNFAFWKSSEYELYFSDNHLKSEQRGFKLVGKELFSHVGWLGDPTHKQNYFTHFPKEKRDDVIRIGAFGDSYTYGDEVDDLFNFPKLLQDKLGAKYEVLNFGNPGWGFFQSYTLWKSLGVDYNLDIILFGPACFQADRDESFSTGWERNPFSLHSLYKLTDVDKVSRVDIKGSNVIERFNYYNSFFPDSNLIRMDRFAPGFYHSMNFSHGSLSNPFYQSQNLIDIYKVQLREIAKRTPRIIISHSNSDLVSKLESVTKLELSHLEAFSNLNHFPYVMTKHYSSLGNELIASVFLNKLKKESKKIKVIKLSNSKPKPVSVQAIENEVTDVSVNIGTQKIGGFNRLSQSSDPLADNRDFIKLLKHKNFLLFKGYGQSILDSFGTFYSRESFGESVFFEDESTTVALPIKNIGANIFYVELPEGFIVESFIFNQIKSGVNFKLHYNNKNMLLKNNKYRYVDYSKEDNFFKFTASPNKLIDVNSIEDSGDIELLISGKHSSARITLDHYFLREIKL
jgi:hypothetical protein